MQAEGSQPPAPDLERLRHELAELAVIADPTERLLEVAALITEALSDLGLEPVVVGGLALAYWSGSDQFVTADIDVVVPRRPELDERLAALGFARRGREWVLPGFDVVFEAPGETLEPGDQGEWAELASGRRVKLLSPEDVLLWRLREWVHWHHTSGFHQAAHLLFADQLDTERLDQRATAEGLGLALTELRRLAVADDLDTWQITEAGREIERRIYSEREP
jgi:hypothetical protein